LQTFVLFETILRLVEFRNINFIPAVMALIHSY